METSNTKLNCTLRCTHQGAKYSLINERPFYAAKKKLFALGNQFGEEKMRTSNQSLAIEWIAFRKQDRSNSDTTGKKVVPIATRGVVGDLSGISFSNVLELDLIRM